MLALLFPGQASQAVGMGVELRRASARARELFGLADLVTGLPITRLTEEGPLERLTDTRVAQPALVATSLAALAVLNAPGQLIISGTRTAIERASELARATGAKGVLPLNVGDPFHSDYMRP